ncbi:MAG: hypothetical protein ACLUER_00615 [Odoribacter splanchnicus]
MKTKQDILWENRVRVILTLILITLYITTIVRIGSDMVWGEGMFIVFLGGCILIAFPFIAVFMGIWKNSNK